MLMASVSKDAESLAAGQRKDLFVYLVTLCGISAVFGRSLIFFVRSTGLDHSTEIFRLNDEWFYVLRGEVIRFREYRDDFKRTDESETTIVDAIVRSPNNLEVYSGILRDFSVSSKGELLRIHLTHPKIIPYDAFLEGGTKALDQLKELDVNICVIEYSQIETLLLDYKIFERVSSSEPPASSQAPE